MEFNFKGWISIYVLVLFISCSTDVTKKNTIEELDYPDKLGMVERLDWGWQPIKESFKTHVIKKVTIHHGGVDYPPDKNPIEHVRNLQSWSRSEKKWVDIPYHFMIDPEGKVYETRPINIPGDTNTEYDPAGHALICVMGNYENQSLNGKQLESIIKMCVYLVQHFDLSSDEIKGHKDYSDITVCPGEDLYRYLEDGTIRRKVDEILSEE